MSYSYQVPEGVSDLVIESLNNYWNHGYEPGGFITSVLVNDLYGAVQRADHWNKPNLARIVEYIANTAPYGSWGNPETVNDWLKKGHYFQTYQRKRVMDILSEKGEEFNERE